ncbi:MAG: hypothetical protein D6743_01865 [Calditrichaeota bacterium]|nr:MAG: hypothetical protein D6743_01865 [Calditrichota bacterium]
MASRSLDDLREPIRGLAAQLRDRYNEPEGEELLIYSTLRTMEDQARLYRQGRSLQQIERKAEELRTRWGRPDLAEILLNVGPQFGRKVTFAGPGQSMHNYGLAFDSVPLRHGKPVWQTTKPEDRALWQRYGRLGVELGLEWAGNWTRFREFPHMQEAGARWQDLIRQG